MGGGGVPDNVDFKIQLLNLKVLGGNLFLKLEHLVLVVLQAG